MSDSIIHKKLNQIPTAIVEGGLVGTICGLILVKLVQDYRRAWSQVPPLQSQLGGTGHFFHSRYGDIYYRQAGLQHRHKPKPALVLMHGVGGGASSYEWSDNIEELAKDYQVYAYDALGFGNSERPNLTYSAELYIDLLSEFLETVVKRPAYLVATSVSAGYAIQVAFRNPHLVERLVLIQPAGRNDLTGKRGPNLTGNKSYVLFRSTILGQLLFTFVASRFNIANFLKGQLFFDKKMVNNVMLEQYYITAHQPGAQYAPLAFFAGLLNAETVATFGKLSQSVLLVWGRNSRITPLKEAKTFQMQNKRARLIVIDKARLGANKEKAAEFNQLIKQFLESDNESQASYKFEAKTLS